MLEILRDPIWQTILGIVAIAISIGAMRLQQNIKELTCKVLSVAPLFNVKDDMQGKLKFLFNNKPVKNAFLIILKIVNSGKTPITADEQKRAVTIEIGAEKILATEIIESQPTDLGANVSTENCSIVLQPTLLNSNESVTIKTVVESFGGKIVASARIVGLNQIKTIMPNAEAKMGWISKSVLIGMVAGIIGISSLVLASITYFSPPEITVTRSDTFTEVGEQRSSQINNCGGKSTSEVNSEFSANIVAYINDQKIENASGFFEFPDIGSLQIGQKIADVYGLTYGQNLNKTIGVKFSAPPATKMEYDYRYVNVYSTGEIRIFQPSKNKTTTYSYKILSDVRLEAISSKQLSCETIDSTNDSNNDADVWFTKSSQVIPTFVPEEISLIPSSNDFERLVSFFRTYRHPNDCQSTDIRGISIQVIFFVSDAGSREFFTKAFAENTGEYLVTSNSVGETGYLQKYKQVDGHCNSESIDIYSLLFQRYNAIGIIKIWLVPNSIESDSVQEMLNRIASELDTTFKEKSH